MTGDAHHMLYACLENMRPIVSERFINSAEHMIWQSAVHDLCRVPLTLPRDCHVREPNAWH
jgi:hypothetical protein